MIVALLGVLISGAISVLAVFLAVLLLTTLADMSADQYAANWMFSFMAPIWLVAVAMPF